MCPRLGTKPRRMSSSIESEQFRTDSKRGIDGWYCITGTSLRPGAGDGETGWLPPDVAERCHVRHCTICLVSDDALPPAALLQVRLPDGARMHRARLAGP